MHATPVRVRIALAALIAVLLAAALLFAVPDVRAQTDERPPGMREWDMWDPPWMRRDRWRMPDMDQGMQQRMSRHWLFLHQGPPAEYRGAVNPLTPDPATLAEGRALFSDNCARCHGAAGMGDGDGARSLDPSPALLAYLIQMPMLVDEYLLWSIADGGRDFGTGMPAFRRLLSRDQIWKIVLFMRAGFPPESLEQ